MKNFNYHFYYIAFFVVLLCNYVKRYLLINIRHYITTIKFTLAVFKLISFIYNVARQIKKKLIYNKFVIIFYVEFNN